VPDESLPTSSAFKALAEVSGFSWPGKDQGTGAVEMGAVFAIGLKKFGSLPNGFG
jgi:hypothetical protein